MIRLQRHTTRTHKLRNLYRFHASAIRPLKKSNIFTSMKNNSSTKSTPAPATADLCDAHIPSPTRLQIVQPNLFQSYGFKPSFCGQIHTVKCFESNPLVREVLSKPPPAGTVAVGEEGQGGRGNGHVLVVDGGGSQRCAIMGDMIATFASDNGWNGVVIHGYIRDSKVINGLDIGVKALGTHPLKSLKNYRGEEGVRVSFGGVEFVPGHYLYSDEDGILVSEVPLEI